MTDKKDFEKRAAEIANVSKQPRFEEDGEKVFWSVVQWAKKIKDQPEYKPTSRTRDQWLRAFAYEEPHLSGVLDSAINIDRNRGWNLIGGRNQVNRYTDILHGYEVAPGTQGWRAGLGAAAKAFYSTDMGGLVELGRDGDMGPLRALYHLDSARCEFTGKPDAPLRYYPAKGSPQLWSQTDYMRIAAMISDDENYNGLGFCAVSRCVLLAQIMMAVYYYDLEQLGAQAPKGLLLLMGISADQWKDAMEIRHSNLQGREQDYFSGVSVLASSGIDQVDAKLVALSQLPKDFSTTEFTNLLMYGYALAFGYDPIEFWPVSSGAIGRGNESLVQHEKATGKGGASFSLGFQEALQDELPPTLHFEFHERDDSGALVAAQVAQAQADLVATLFNMQREEEKVITVEQAREMLAEMQIIPEEWAITQEEVTATDESAARSQEYKERLLEKPNIQRALQQFPDEPIVRYTWRPTGITQQIIWKSAADAIQRFQPIKRQEVLFVDPDDPEIMITSADVDAAIDAARRRVGPDFANMLEAEVIDE